MDQYGVTWTNFGCSEISGEIVAPYFTKCSGAIIDEHELMDYDKRLQN